MSPTVSPSTQELLETLRKGNLHLDRMAMALDFPWNPEAISDGDPRRLHNMYARSLLSCYVSKFAELSDGILHAFQSSNFLLFALSGRALIETVATLRYYVQTQYTPIFEAGVWDGEAMKKLIDVDDRHLRGTRFDWESFLLQNYETLIAKEKGALEAKRKKKAAPECATGQPSQVNVSTCIDKWSIDDPAVSMVYSLFCDLVHPNVGSSFLIASASGRDLYFTRSRGESVGLSIFEQSLPMLLSTTVRPFQVLLAQLSATIWQDDEFDASLTNNA